MPEESWTVTSAGRKVRWGFVAAVSADHVGDEGIIARHPIHRYGEDGERVSRRDARVSRQSAVDL